MEEDEKADVEYLGDGLKHAQAQLLHLTTFLPAQQQQPPVARFQDPVAHKIINNQMFMGGMNRLYGILENFSNGPQQAVAAPGASNADKIFKKIQQLQELEDAAKANDEQDQVANTVLPRYY